MTVQTQALSFLFPGSPMVNAILATAYISLIPNVLLYFLPSHIQPASLHTLVSFAVGGLLGDVFLHLLPHAFGGGHDHGHDHHHYHESSVDGDKQNVLVGLGIFGGFFVFYAMDKMMRMLDDSGRRHCHDLGTQCHSTNDLAVGDTQLDDDINKPREGLRQRKKATDNSSKADADDNEMPTKPSAIKRTAYLNLLADFVHNLTDGLAMAASFYASPSIGATTAVAVFFHEIPHEIGDYVLLLQSGFSKQRAMMAQFTTAGGAFLGTMIGIFIEEAAYNSSHHNHPHSTDLVGTGLHWADLVIPMTAGGFLYIASVGVIPDLLNGKRNTAQIATEFTAMGVGVTVMAAIAWNEV